ncbi:MAG: CehA/McbA family metallohydrolase [Chloroflexi bacterium]|nr:CehA/McbA family metallohydrolase [Chloroflexota bacterium]
MWLKGNLHTHTNQSDGDAPPNAVAAWYAGHGYDFLAITDHNLLTRPAEEHGLQLLTGTEISLVAERKPIHVNAFNIGDLAVIAKPDAGIVETLQDAVNAANAAGGLPMINHPNFKWAFGPAEMARVAGWSLLEIHNASTDCNNFGYGGRMGVEAMWDELLSAGLRVFGVAADDAHDFLKERWGHVSPPGLAWVQVCATDRSARAIVSALQAGDFYASTEIVVEQWARDGDTLRLPIRPQRDYTYTTHFIGQRGRALASVDGINAAYPIRGDERYVRAKVCSSNGGWAWTQPHFIG